MNISNETQAREYIDGFPTQTTEVADIEIEYKILGNKGEKPLIFIPGLKVTMDMWEPTILRELAQSKHSIIVYNNRGTGNSSTGVKDYSITQLANDAAGLLDALNIEKADILGWSMGAYIAEELALVHPNKVNSLILYGSGPGGDKAIPSSPELMETLSNVAYQIGIDRRLLSSVNKAREDIQGSALDPQFRCLKAITYVSFAELQPRLSHEPLVHNNYEEIFYIINGIGKIKIGNEEATLRDGDISYIPESTKHSIINDGEEMLRLAFGGYTGKQKKKRSRKQK